MCHFTVEGLIIVQKYVMELGILQWDSNRYIGSDCEPVFITGVMQLIILAVERYIVEI